MPQAPTHGATVNLDDAQGQPMSVVAQPLEGLPGVLMFTAPDDGVLVSATVDVSDAESLTLVVEFGGEGNIRDYADWGSARLLKK